MAFTVPPLPFAMDALEPYMSSKTQNQNFRRILNGFKKAGIGATPPFLQIANELKRCLWKKSFAQRRAVRFLTTPLSALTTLSFGTA